MKIGLDATPLTIPTGGIARYTSELGRALAECFPEDEFVLLSDQRFQPPLNCPPNLAGGPGPRNLLERRWWLWGVQRAMRRCGVELFHGTDFAVPYLPTRPSVMTLHDLSPWIQPGWHHAAVRVRRRSPYLIRLGLATMIVTPSRAIRAEAIERLGASPDRTVAVPLAAARHFKPEPVQVPQTPYLLFVGTLEPRKNVSFLISAWEELRKKHCVDLVLAGRRRADFAPLPARPGLRVLGEVPDSRLPALYSNALAVVYPSLYEGFGLPVLEAMQCAAAVIASRDPAIREVAGDAAVLLDSSDARSWVHAMETAATQPEVLAGWRERCRRRAAEFSWERTAALTREVYDEAMKIAGRAPGRGRGRQ